LRPSRVTRGSAAPKRFAAPENFFRAIKKLGMARTVCHAARL
jgi:hypothetical protein